MLVLKPARPSPHLLVNMGSSASSARCSRTRSRPPVLRHNATSMPGSEHTASLLASRPDCGAGKWGTTHVLGCRRGGESYNFAQPCRLVAGKVCPCWSAGQAPGNDSTTTASKLPHVAQIPDRSVNLAVWLKVLQHGMLAPCRAPYLHGVQVRLRHARLVQLPVLQRVAVQAVRHHAGRQRKQRAAEPPRVA